MSRRKWDGFGFRLISFRDGNGNPLIDYMKVYLLFESATAHPYGTKGVYKGLANRRRTWIAREQFRLRYMAHVTEGDRPLINSDPDHRKWRVGGEVDSLWSEPLEMLESQDQWLRGR